MHVNLKLNPNHLINLIYLHQHLWFAAGRSQVTLQRVQYTETRQAGSRAASPYHLHRPYLLVSKGFQQLNDTKIIYTQRNRVKQGSKLAVYDLLLTTVVPLTADTTHAAQVH